MELIRSEWLGRWENFENYIESADANMMKCWRDAEAAAGALPMFADGVKAFWQKACATITHDNPVRLDGWSITEWENGITIEWLGADGSLGKYNYIVEKIIPTGLERKENFLFKAVDASADLPADSPFSYMLAMEPMPKREAYQTGDYLSHLHFQFGRSEAALIGEDGKLTIPMWYATMCAAEGDMLARCNIVRGLHRLPKWDSLMYSE